MRFSLKFYLLLKEEFELFGSFTITGAGWVNDVNNFSFSSLSGEDDFEIGSFATFPFISASSFSSLPFLFLFLFFQPRFARLFFCRRKKICKLTSRFQRRFPAIYSSHILPRKYSQNFSRPSANISSLRLGTCVQRSCVPTRYRCDARCNRNPSFLIGW